MDRERILRSAEKHATHSRYREAIREYEKVLDQSPDDPRLLLRIGDMYTRTQAYPRALLSYANAARIYENEGFAAKAVAIYKQVQQLVDTQVPHLGDYFLYVYPRVANLYLELRLAAEALGMYDTYASVLARSGRLREAACILEIVVARGGDNPLTRLRLAELLLEDGQEADATKHFLVAVEGLLSLDRVDEALRVLDHTLLRLDAPVLARRAAEVHLARGQSNAENNDGMQALVRLQQAFTAEPKNLQTLALLAKAFEAIDQKERAFEVRKETVRIAKEQGAIETAQALLDELRTEAPEDPGVRALIQTLAPPPIPPESSIPEVSIEPQEPQIAIERHEVVVDVNMPAIEETGLPVSTSLAEEIDLIEKRAIGFVELGDFANAVYTLQIGIELSPGSTTMRTLLKDLLVRQGSVGQAVGHLLVLAKTYEGGRNREGCVSCLREVLSLAPEHLEARTKLAELVPESAAPAPLPPILESVGKASDAGNGQPPPIPASVLEDIDLGGRAPLESIRGFRGGGGISEALEEAEFFASRALFEDALAIVHEQLALHPGNATLMQRVRELEEQAAEAEPLPSVLGVGIPTAEATRVAHGADPDFLQSALAELDVPSVVEERAIAKQSAVDVDGLFDAIRKGFAAQVEESDSEMQYDLGVAYLEMGQLDDAVKSFRKASLDPVRACVSLSMVASVHQRRGDGEAALHALLEAAKVPKKSRSEEVGVHYELAKLYQALGDVDGAISHFERVVRLAPDFRDARLLLRDLRKASGKELSLREEELDRVFDDLLADPEAS